MQRPKVWESPAGQNVVIPQGSELMAARAFSWIYYNPHLNISYYINGSLRTGFQVIEYPYPLCSLCAERRRRYLRDGT